MKGEEIKPYINAVADKYGIKISPTYEWDYWVGEIPEPNEDAYAITTKIETREYQGQEMKDHTAYIGSIAFSDLNIYEFAAVLAHEARHTWQVFLMENPSQDKYGAMENLPPNVMDFSMNMTYQDMLLEADA